MFFARDLLRLFYRLQGRFWFAQRVQQACHAMQRGGQVVFLLQLTQQGDALPKLSEGIFGFVEVVAASSQLQQAYSDAEGVAQFSEKRQGLRDKAALFPVIGFDARHPLQREGDSAGVALGPGDLQILLLQSERGFKVAPQLRELRQTRQRSARAVYIPRPLRQRNSLFVALLRLFPPSLTESVGAVVTKQRNDVGNVVLRLIYFPAIRDSTGSDRRRF